MSRVIDALVAYRVLKLLVTPFNRTKAFELGIIDAKGKVLKKSRDISDPKERNAYTLLIRFVFNLKRILSKVGIRGPLGSSAAAALAFFKEQSGENLEVERVVYNHLKEQGFEFQLDENYGEPLTEGTYKVKHDIHNSEGEVVINMDESVEFKETTDTIMGYDIFKHNGIYLTTEDLYV
jgi:hypothetical protein|tara:strand:- start:124 stop:660 length:537 start_codon:yes stop_codon:yes gene_type:complete